MMSTTVSDEDEDDEVVDCGAAMVAAMTMRQLDL